MSRLVSAPDILEVVRLQAAVSAGTLDEGQRELLARLIEQVGLSLQVADELGASSWVPVAEAFARCIEGGQR